ncbi:hypothetical protein JYU34_011540 [Plutella xylostella]|uniref:Uncharacterized protein n=1 Tax=Plutella xylostella TaxID=51655 RepID=A0ABQ7QHP4_PLUXY|nr:hypothetical protein JYU34_011540 [Plutella xylostella]
MRRQTQVRSVCSSSDAGAIDDFIPEGAPSEPHHDRARARWLVGLDAARRPDAPRAHHVPLLQRHSQLAFCLFCH